MSFIYVGYKQKRLINEIDMLPIDLKTKIVDKILASITPVNTSIDKLWIKEKYGDDSKQDVVLVAALSIEGLKKHVQIILLIQIYFPPT